MKDGEKKMKEKKRNIYRKEKERERRKEALIDLKI